MKATTRRIVLACLAVHALVQPMLYSQYSGKQSLPSELEVAKTQLAQNREQIAGFEKAMEKSKAA